MAYPNGRIPQSALASVPGSPGEYLLKGPVHDSFVAMRAAAARDGVTLKVADGYRPIARQFYWRNWWCSRGMCFRAALPGTSNHGLGHAIDFVMDPAGRVYRWLSNNAHKYGWSHAEGARVGEAWHWTYIGGYKAPARDPLWFLTAEERSKVREYQSLKKRGVNKARRGQLFRWFIERRKNIYRAAKHGSWGKAQRKRRYAYFKNLTQ